MAESQFAAIDEQKFHRFHVRAMLVTGLGVFCDGYDISAIGLVLKQALAAYGIHKVGAEGGALSAIALVGSMLGALVFGLLAQKGRKRFYGLDALILGVAALAQAFMPSLGWLIACRFVLGIGVGADYVLSPTIMAEHSNRADRGKAIGLGFGTMWPIGALAAAVLKLLLDSFHVPPDLVWRIVLAAGAVPALGVMYFRRRDAGVGAIPVQARRRQGQGDGGDARGRRASKPPRQAPTPVRSARCSRCTPGTSSPPRCCGWSTTWWSTPRSCSGRTSSPATCTSPPRSSRSRPSCCSSFRPRCSAPGCDRPVRAANRCRYGASSPGRWCWGSSPCCARSSPAWRCWPSWCLGLFNIALTGPGLVSGAGIFGVELAPTRIRSVAQSITVVGGRIGAAIAGFVFPSLNEHIGFVASMWGLAGLSLLGGVLSQLLVPETSSRSLEEINLELIPAE